MNTFNDRFYTYPKIAKRILRMAPRNWKAPHKILLNVITNVTCRRNHMLDRRVYDGRETGPATVESAPAAFSSEPHRRVET